MKLRIATNVKIIDKKEVFSLGFISKSTINEY